MSGSHRGVPERIEETRNGDRCQELQPAVANLPERVGYG